MNIQQNISLKEYTTFRIGGNAKYFCIVTNEDELIDAINFSKKNKVPFFILGGGSNLLISDDGYAGLMIKMEMKGIKYEEDKNGSNVKVTVMAGESWDALVNETVEKGLYGLENLSLIPGTVGASAVQNIGAYGSEVKDVVHSVNVIDIEKDEFKTFSKDECKFKYRDSIFKKEIGRYVVTSVVFNLNKKGRINIEYKDLKDYFTFKKIKDPTLKDVRLAVVEIRTRKLPDLKKYGTAGSFFKNVIVSESKAKELLAKFPGMILHKVNDRKVKIPIAWILDHACGFRGVKKGNVGTYENQALVLVNYGDATASEIISLAQKMVDEVYLKTGIEIEPEVEYVG